MATPGGRADRDHGGGHDRRDRHHHGVRSVSDFLHPAPAQGQAADPAQSVGATNGQIFELLAWECAYITLGEPDFGGRPRRGCGLGGDRALEEVSLFLSWPLVLTGQACGLLAVAFGMLMPSLRAMKAPWWGRMEGRKGRHVKVKP